MPENSLGASEEDASFSEEDEETLSEAEEALCFSDSFADSSADFFSIESSLVSVLDEVALDEFSFDCSDFASDEETWLTDDDGLASLAGELASWLEQEARKREGRTRANHFDFIANLL